MLRRHRSKLYCAARWSCGNSQPWRRQLTLSCASLEPASECARCEAAFDFSIARFCDVDNAFALASIRAETCSGGVALYLACIAAAFFSSFAACCLARSAVASESLSFWRSEAHSVRAACSDFCRLWKSACCVAVIVPSARSDTATPLACCSIEATIVPTAVLSSTRLRLFCAGDLLVDGLLLLLMLLGDMLLSAASAA